MSTVLPPIATANVVGNAGGGALGNSPTAEEKGLGKVMSGKLSESRTSVMISAIVVSLKPITLDLSKKLARRQAPEELVQRNILRGIALFLPYE